MTGRIGFCCKWVSPTNDEAAELLINQKTTTIAALSRLDKPKVMEKLLGIVTLNMASMQRLVGWVGNQPQQRRMLRLSSEILPAYTHEVANWAYQEPAMREIMEDGFAAVGRLARELDVRLSFHPGQYCLLNTVNEGAFIRAIAEFEYHVEMMRMMGFTGGWHPHGATINIHTGSRAGGTSGFIEGMKALSEDGRNLLTVENDEMSFGLSDIEPLAEHCAIVLDIHHEWIKSGGQYIQPDDPRIEYVKASWRGTQPLGHFSTSRESVLTSHAPDVLPDFQSLRQQGFSIRDLRGHSDMCWNSKVNEWAISHLSWMDIEVEAKSKNLASEQLFKQAQQK